MIWIRCITGIPVLHHRPARTYVGRFVLYMPLTPVGFIDLDLYLTIYFPPEPNSGVFASWALGDPVRFKIMFSRSRTYHKQQGGRILI